MPAAEESEPSLQIALGSGETLIQRSRPNAEPSIELLPCGVESLVGPIATALAIPVQKAVELAQQVGISSDAFSVLCQASIEQWANAVKNVNSSSRSWILRIGIPIPGLAEAIERAVPGVRVIHAAEPDSDQRAGGISPAATDRPHAREAARGLEGSREEILRDVCEALDRGGYREKTRQAYLHHIGRAIGDEGALSRESVDAYLKQLERARVAPSSRNQALSAVQFLCRRVYPRPDLLEGLSRAPVRATAPRWLTRREVAAVIRSAENLKHRTILILMYGTGARVSEVARLRIEDFEPGNSRVWVRDEGGQRHRFLSISGTTQQVIERYRAQYRPEVWLFPGSPADEPISLRSIQKIFENARVKAGLPPDVTAHTLRHTFAAHVLETGIDFASLQELLGHENIKTTRRYARLQSQNPIAYRSPLEDLAMDLSGEI